jgi:hypothetical protein
MVFFESKRLRIQLKNLQPFVYGRDDGFGSVRAMFILRTRGALHRVWNVAFYRCFLRISSRCGASFEG